MFGFGKKKQVNVQYIEVGKKSPFKSAKVSTADLPEVYELDSSLTLDGREWTVVAAVPDTREEFAKSGKLDIFLSAKAQFKVPDNVLFSLPTINDEIGVVKARDTTGDIFTVHEDDWRQQEFVARKHLEMVRKELAEVEKIHKTQRNGAGYKRMHIREGLPLPLDSTGLTVSGLWDSFEFNQQFGGLAIEHYNGLVEGGFAMEAAGIGTLWGELDENGNVACLNITLPEGQADFGAVQGPLTPFCTRHKLVLVNWPAARMFSPPTA